MNQSPSPLFWIYVCPLLLDILSEQPAKYLTSLETVHTEHRGLLGPQFILPCGRVHLLELAAMN